MGSSHDPIRKRNLIKDDVVQKIQWNITLP